ncbi:MAG: CBS domain-containing protein [Pseudomonadales bacterium]
MPDANPLQLAFARKHPAELAGYLAEQPMVGLVEALNGLPVDVGASVIARLPHVLVVQLLATQSDEAVSRWLERAALDDALILVLHLDETRRARVLAALPIRHMRRTLEQLVIYPRKTVGALVDPTVVRLAASTPLGQAIDRLRAGNDGTAEWIWLVDDQGRYVGLLDLSRALLARSEHLPVGELAVPLNALRAETALVAALDAPEWLQHPELPVVDHLNHLLGSISRERLVRELQQEAPRESGLADGIGALAYQYFRVMNACLGELLGGRRPS